MYKGISLHIGVNRLSINQYKKAALLCSPENDARAMAELAQLEGYKNITVLTNEQATKTNVLRHFSESILALNAGDTFLLTFSGHGGQADDTNSDEKDGKDERWCLYDDYLYDDEIGNRWKEFGEGVRIIVVSSSCHSGTGIKPYPDKRPFGKRTTLKKATRRQVLTVYPDDPEITASIIHLFACEDKQQARDGCQFSVFTDLLLKHWDQGRFEGSHEDLVWKISLESGYLQTPGIATLGKNCEALVNAKPFKLLT
jgi:metacaspase-1